MEFDPKASAKVQNLESMQLRESGIFKGCREDLSFDRFCEYFFKEDVYNFDPTANHHQFLKDLISSLSVQSREALLLTLLDNAVIDRRFAKTPGQVNVDFSGCSDALGACYLKNIESIFTGQCCFKQFESACGAYFKESFASFGINPKRHEIFSSILPESFYEKKEIQDIIKSQIFDVVKRQPILLPEYLTLPGFKDVVNHLRRDPDIKQHFKDCIEDYFRHISGSDIKYKIRKAENTIRTFGMASEVTVGRQLASIIELLDIPEIMKSSRFMSCVGRQIEESFRVKDPIAAINWLSLLPRDPDRGMRLLPEAQRYVDYSRKAARRYVINYLMDKDCKLSKKDILPLVNTIRNFVPMRDRKSEKFFKAVQNACYTLAEVDTEITYQKSLIKILPFKFRERLVEDESFAYKILPSQACDFMKFNCKIDLINSSVGEKVDERLVRTIATLDRKVARFKSATAFFSLGTNEMSEFSPAVKERLRTYHHLTDLCTEDDAPSIGAYKISVSAYSWYKLLDRAQELLKENRFHKARVYVDKALSLAVSVADIECEELQVARLFNLKARTETSVEKQADWLSKELYLRMRILDHTHDSLAPVYRSFSRILKEKANQNPPGESRNEIRHQAKLCQTLAKGIEEVNRNPRTRRGKAIKKFLESAMKKQRLHKAVGFNTEAIY